MNIQKLFLATLLSISFIGCNSSIGASGDEEGPCVTDNFGKATNEESVRMRFNQVCNNPGLLGKFFEETNTGPHTILIGDYPHRTMLGEAATRCLWRKRKKSFRFLAEMLKFVDPKDKDLIRIEEKFRGRCDDCINTESYGDDFCVRAHGVRYLLLKRMKKQE